jgi:hypothetical protein
MPRKNLHYCDGCGKMHHDVQSCGRDAAGDPDAPDLCFLCRKELERGRSYCGRRKCYIPNTVLRSEELERFMENELRWAREHP